MLIRCSRDRLAFSKSILKRFIRDCVDRDSAVGSPWIVKRALAEKYGLDLDMSEEVRRGVEEFKKGEIEKRKKVSTELQHVHCQTPYIWIPARCGRTKKVHPTSDKRRCRPRRKVR